MDFHLKDAIIGQNEESIAEKEAVISEEGIGEGRENFRVVDNDCSERCQQGCHYCKIKKKLFKF